MRTLPDTVRTRLQALAWCEARLTEASLSYGHGTDNPADEAFALVAGVVGLPENAGWEELELQGGERSAVADVLARRVEEACPLPYLLGEAWFAGLRFACDRRALVPRSPLAELIVDGFSPWYSGPPPRRILDLCCGGGAIGISCAVYHPEATVTLADIDPDALDLARENVARHGLQQRMRLCRSDLFSAVRGEVFDIVLCNPPYVDASDLERMPAEYRHEPPLGLAAGHDGLLFARRILAGAHEILASHGLLLLELGNSWEALESAYPTVPFVWVELACGGHGVLAISAGELREHAAALAHV